MINIVNVWDLIGNVTPDLKDTKVCRHGLCVGASLAFPSLCFFIELQFLILIIVP